MGMSPTPCTPCPSGSSASMATPRGAEWGARDTPPPGTPPPPYHTNTQVYTELISIQMKHIMRRLIYRWLRSFQPCADPQRAIISMEEDDSPASVSLRKSSILYLFVRCHDKNTLSDKVSSLLFWIVYSCTSYSPHRPCMPCVILEPHTTIKIFSLFLSRSIFSETTDEKVDIWYLHN